MHTFSDTIVALCTPSGPGALALIRISGPHARECVAQCAKFSSGKSASAVPSHTIHHGFVTDESTVVDEVLFFIMDAPKTFTGEDTIEITCHNNQFIIDALIRRLISCGARLAHKGEFSRQAVLNNKMDIIKAEALNDLIHAQSQQALSLAMQQMHGSLSAELKKLEEQLLKSMALCEASFEFLDEDVDFSDQLREQITTSMQTIELLQKNNASNTIIRQGVRIALIGSVNAGKSSLFNCLIGKQRAIVTPIAGTTRDVIEAGLYYKGLYWTFADTAGLRTTDDVIEQEGIERSYREAATADIILIIIDGSRIPNAQEIVIYTDLLKTYGHKSINVLNKCDQRIDAPFPFIIDLAVSAHVNTGIVELQTTLENRVQNLLENTSSPYLLTHRQISLLHSVYSQIQTIQKMLIKKPIAYELVSYHLQEAIATNAELTGKSVSEKMMDTVFKEFCVGK